MPGTVEVGCLTEYGAHPDESCFRGFWASKKEKPEIGRVGTRHLIWTKFEPNFKF